MVIISAYEYNTFLETCIFEMAELKTVSPESLKLEYSPLLCENCFFRIGVITVWKARLHIDRRLPLRCLAAIACLSVLYSSYKCVQEGRKL